MTEAHPEVTADRKAEPGARTVVVTGGGSGIGRAVAIRLLNDGFDCVVAGPVEDHLVETLELAGAGRGSVFQCDIRDPGARCDLISSAAQGGSLFGLVNNAGVAYSGPLLDQERQGWQDVLETNLLGTLSLTLHAIDEMRRHQTGRIVNMCSIRGIRVMNSADYGGHIPTAGDTEGPIRMMSYAVSKSALIHLSRELAAAVGPWGITVNAVSPGIVQHPTYDPQSLRSERTALGRDPSRPGLGDRLDEQAVRSLSQRVPLGRIASVDEIAGPVSFLMSKDASYITGANIVVDGGTTIW